VYIVDLCTAVTEGGSHLVEAEVAGRAERGRAVVVDGVGGCEGGHAMDDQPVRRWGQIARGVDKAASSNTTH